MLTRRGTMIKKIEIPFSGRLLINLVREMTFRVFRIIPSGGNLEVDFKVNLPVDVFRAFAVFKGQKAVDSQSSDLSNPFGQPDYLISAQTAVDGVLSCRFDCFGKLDLVDQELKIDVVLKQDGQAKEFSLQPAKMQNHKDIISQRRKDAWIEIKSE